MQPANLSTRFSAMNLDMLIVGLLSHGCGMLVESLAPELATMGNMFFVSLVLSFFYFVYPTKKYGQTPGKWLLSLKVIPLGSEWESLTWGQVFLREFLGKTLSALPFFLGYVWARFNMRNRAWHDYLGRTEVISLIWEEEKTLIQKIQHTMLGIMTIPLGVALVLGAFLYTPLPLNSIKEKIESAGIEVGALTGSLAGGLRFSEIRRHNAEQSYSLGAVDVKFNLSALVYDRVFLIEKLSAEEGRIEVPEDFSWMTILLNLMAISSGEIGGPEGALGHFKMGRLQLKNIAFEHQKKVLSRLDEFTLKNLEMADRELRINEAQFQIEGLKFKAQGFVSSGGGLEVASVIGGLGPEFLPLLKVPVDFHLQGRIGKNPSGTRLEGGMTIDKIRFSYADQKLSLTTDKLIVNEMFKTSLPLEELDLKLSTAGANALELMSSVAVVYDLKICGQEFKNVPQGAGVIHTRPEREFRLKIAPKPLQNFGERVFSKESTLDDLFGYELRGTRKTSVAFSSQAEVAADLCYQKAPTSLTESESLQVKAFESTAQVSAPGAGLETLLTKAVPITVASSESTALAAATETETLAEISTEASAEVEPPTEASPEAPTATPAPAASPSPASSTVAKPSTGVTPSTVEAIRAAMSEASARLRQGKYSEARSILEALVVTPEVLVNPTELGSFYNLKAWIYLYSGQAAEAQGQFELAFNARKTVADAEGLFRAHQELKNDQEARRWWEYLQTAVRDNPESLKSLTPNLQKQLTSEASEESPQ